MTGNIDIIFNSEKGMDQKLFQLASGYISETRILFEKEHVVAVIQAAGSVEFFHADGQPIAAGKLPPVQSGKEVYEEVRCQAEGALIHLHFPIYKWIDNYPHCDGEHDRWDTKIIGYHTLTLDLSTHSLLWQEEA